MEQFKPSIANECLMKLFVAYTQSLSVVIHNVGTKTTYPLPTFNYAVNIFDSNNLVKKQENTPFWKPMSLRNTSRSINNMNLNNLSSNILHLFDTSHI